METICKINGCNDNVFCRGICSKCNLGLGLFEDNIEKLNSAIKYLNKFLIKEQNK